jgi:hypothetical protein
LSDREIIKQKRLKDKYIHPWVGVDLDSTLAVYDTFISPTHIGEPIPAMVERVQKLLMSGVEVKIFTARVSDADPLVRLAVIDAIEQWCLLHIGRALPVTCIKDYGMQILYDDRARHVEPNTGRVIGE